MRRRATISRRNLKVLRSVRLDYWRPSTRQDCATVPRPCPYVSCRHNLYADMKPNGNVRLNFPDLEPHEMIDSCSLDVAEDHADAPEGGATLERIGHAIGVTREMVRQMEYKMFRKLRQLVRPDGELDAEPRMCGPLGVPDMPKPWEDADG